jgi:ribonuclease J
VIELYDNGVKISDKSHKLDTVMIDGLGIGHMSGEYVMKARQIMSQDGVLMLIFKIDTKTRELVGNIQIESRGFVYSSEVQKIHTMIVDFARKEYYQNLKKIRDIRYNLRLVKDDLTEYVLKTIGREPLIVPMFVYINADNKGHISDDVSAEDALIGMTIEEQGIDSPSITHDTQDPQ